MTYGLNQRHCLEPMFNPDHREMKRRQIQVTAFPQITHGSDEPPDTSLDPWASPRLTLYTLLTLLTGVFPCSVIESCSVQHHLLISSVPHIFDILHPRHDLFSPAFSNNDHLGLDALLCDTRTCSVCKGVRLGLCGVGERRLGLQRGKGCSSKRANFRAP